MKLMELTSKEFSDSFEKVMGLEKIPSKTMYVFKGIAKQLKAEVEKFNEIRKTIIDECGEKDEKGTLVMLNETQVKIKLDSVKEAEERLKALGEVDIALPEVKFEDIGVNKEQLTPKDLFMLDFIKE